MSEPLHRTSIGSIAQAQGIAQRAYAAIPAYKAFRRESGAGAGFASLPVTDKASYIAAHSFSQLTGDNVNSAFSLLRSAGSSGRAYYWPQLKPMPGHEPHIQLRQFLETSFAIDRRRTLAVVGLALGSWIGGDAFSSALKAVAASTTYPFCVFSPGSKHEEIIEIVLAAAPMVDQVILFLCPSAIGHLHLLARSTSRALPEGKMRYVVLGEPFPESLRLALTERAGLSKGDPVMLSVYGSADTGLLGVESAASAAARQVLAANPEVCRGLGLGLTVPHLFHCVAPDAFLEAVDGELCVTRWQGVPLVRYNLHDSVKLLSWSELRRELLASGGAGPLAGVLEAAGDGLPDVLAISGRSDRCLILCGTNISEAMLDEAVTTCGAEDVLTGLYQAAIEYDGGRQHLSIELEFREGAAMDEEACGRVYHAIVASLSRVQPEFADDWQNVYRAWDDDAAHRIIQVRAVRWPAMSGVARIKHKGIIQ